MAVRVLHVLGSMNPGGVETWLLNVVRKSIRGRVVMDFVVHTDQPAIYDDAIRELGCRIFSCPNPRNPIRYAQQLQSVLRRFGPYDVLHSHVHHYSGFVLWLGRIAGIPARIAHSHNDTRVLTRAAAPLRKAYLALGRRLILQNCTRGLAASREAACDLFGCDWAKDPRFEVLPCGVDFSAFRQPVDRAAIRAGFGIQNGEIVFGHVGRFDPQKNHGFLVAIAAEIAKREPRARFLFVGDGPLRPEIEDRARRAGLQSRAIFTGFRPDIPRLLTGAMDAFLFPSLYEGLGLALVEAQAANLPATISDSIPPEADVVPRLIQRLSLSAPAPAWAECALEHLDRSGDALAELERSCYNIDNTISDLLEVYGALGKAETFAQPPNVN